MNRGCKKGEKGFSTVWLLGFAMIILMCGLFIFDLTRVYIEREKLVSAADAAAAAGATALDESALPDIKLDPALAKARCEEMLNSYAASGGAAHSVLDPAGSQTRCDIDPANPQAVIAQATGKVKFSPVVGLLGLNDKLFIVTSRARPSCSDAVDANSLC